MAATPTGTKISDLSSITTPSTNTWLEVADLAATPKSRKISLPNLKTAVNPLSGTANTLAKWIGTNSIGSLANGEGILANDGSGSFAWTTDVGAVSQTITYNTIVVTKVTVQTNSFTIGKGGHLTITNNITIQTNGTLTLSNLPAPSVLVLGTNRNVTSATLSGLTLGNDNTLTASGGGGGSGVSTAVTPLAYSGTNITGFDCSTNNMTYTLALTNHCLFGSSTFANLQQKTTNHFFTLGFQQDSAGGWVPKFTNTVVTWADSNQPVIKTNAGAVSYLYFHTHLFTNSMLVGSPNINVQ